MTIHEACRKGDLDSVRRLVAEDPALVDADDQYQWRPIFHAALHRHRNVVQFLLDAGADVGAHDGDVLHYAGEVPGNKSIVRMLIAAGALDPHVRPRDDLARQFLSALFVGDELRVGAILGLHPIQATLSDGRGDHPIHHAARNGDVAIVSLLIAHGADVNAANGRQHTVLYCAGGHGHLETVRLLLEHGADACVKFTSDGKTLLQWLSQYPDDQRFKGIAEVLRKYDR